MHTMIVAQHDCCTTNYKVLQTLKTQGNFSSLTSSPCISHGGNNTGNKSLVRGNFPLLQKFKKLMSAIVATKSGHALERFQNVCGERDVVHCRIQLSSKRNKCQTYAYSTAC